MIDFNVSLKEAVDRLLKLHHVHPLSVTQEEELSYLRIVFDHIANTDQQYLEALMLDKNDAIDVLNLLNTLSGSNYRPVQTNIKLILDRLKEYSKEDLLNMVKVKCHEWNDTEMSQYLRPATLFGKSKCAQYVGQGTNYIDEDHGAF